MLPSLLLNVYSLYVSGAFRCNYSANSLSFWPAPSLISQTYGWTCPDWIALVLECTREVGYKHR
jgi:hypothetical protein